MFQKLEGHKTIICGVLLMITATFHYFGILNSELSALLITFFLSGMGLAVAAKIERGLITKKK